MSHYVLSGLGRLCTVMAAPMMRYVRSCSLRLAQEGHLWLRSEQRVCAVSYNASGGRRLLHGFSLLSDLCALCRAGPGLQRRLVLRPQPAHELLARGDGLDLGQHLTECRRAASYHARPIR
jgi:hypothetical protein